MFDSLVNLIIGTFVVMFPVLILIGRSRKRRAGRGSVGDGTIRDDGHLSPRDRDLAEPVRSTVHSTASVRTTGAEKKWTTKFREFEAPEDVKPVVSIMRSTKQPGISRIGKLPPFQRAMVFREILGPPRGINPIGFGE